MIRDETIKLLQRGGFNTRKWASNHRHACAKNDGQILELDRAIQDNTVMKTLGMIWNSERDELGYSVKQIDSSITNYET